MTSPKTIAKIEHQVRKYERAREIQAAHLSASGQRFFSANPPVAARDARTAMIKAFFRFKSICPPNRIDEYVKSGRIDEKIRIVPPQPYNDSTYQEEMRVVSQNRSAKRFGFVIPVTPPGREAYGIDGTVHSCKTPRKRGTNPAAGVWKKAKTDAEAKAGYYIERYAEMGLENAPMSADQVDIITAMRFGPVQCRVTAIETAIYGNRSVVFAGWQQITDFGFIVARACATIIMNPKEPARVKNAAYDAIRAIDHAQFSSSGAV